MRTNNGICRDAREQFCADALPNATKDSSPCSMIAVGILPRGPRWSRNGHILFFACFAVCLPATHRSYSGISHRIITGKLFARDVKARLEMTTADDVVKLQNAVYTEETDRTGALVAVRVVECRICNREVAGSNLGRSDFAPRSILGLPSRRGR